MHLYNSEKYPNLLADIPITARDFAMQIKDYKLEFLPDHSEIVEWKMKLPMFVDSFYSLVLSEIRIPSQQEFIEYYLAGLDYSSYPNISFTPEIISGINARGFRAYPSLVRDVVFNKYVEQHLTDFNVKYNIKLDVEEGIDMLLEDSNGHCWGVCLFTDTKRGYLGRTKKEHRHILFENVNYVEMPVAFKGSLKWGDFFLYEKKELNELKNILAHEQE